MALLAAFCSQKAWSVSSSSILLSTTFLTQSGSVGSCSLRMVFSLTAAKINFIGVKGKSAVAEAMADEEGERFFTRKNLYKCFYADVISPLGIRRSHLYKCFASINSSTTSGTKYCTFFFLAMDCRINVAESSIKGVKVMVTEG